MNIKCPHCRTEYDAEESEYGRFVKCEICGKGFVVGTSSFDKMRSQPLPQKVNVVAKGKRCEKQPRTQPEAGKSISCTTGHRSLSHGSLWKSLLSLKWIWPCLLVIGFTVKVHNQNHRGRGDRRAKSSAICPICWCNKPLGNGNAEIPTSQKNQEASNDSDQNIASRIVQKRLREIEENQRQEKITEAKRLRNIEKGRPETTGFAAADYAAYSGGGRGGWAWREKKENRTSGPSRSFLDDLDYAFEKSTGFSSDTRTDQEKQEDAILREVLEATKNRYQQNLQRIKCTEHDYSMSEGSVDLAILDSRGQVCHIICDGNSSSLTDYPHFMSQAVALQLIQDRSSIAILEMVIDPIPLTPRPPPMPTAEDATHSS